MVSYFHYTNTGFWFESLNCYSYLWWHDSYLVLSKANLLMRHSLVSLNTLLHWQMDTISQTTVWNAFFLMKMYQFWLKFHGSLFLRVQLLIFQHWFRQWLGADQATSHYLNHWWSDYWCTYESLGLNELQLFLGTVAYNVSKNWVIIGLPPSPQQNGRHVADDIFRYIFVNEKFFILIKIHWNLFLRVQLTITQQGFR